MFLLINKPNLEEQTFFSYLDDVTYGIDRHVVIFTFKSCLRTRNRFQFQTISQTFLLQNGLAYLEKKIFCPIRSLP
jgi:hypothetical protein